MNAVDIARRLNLVRHDPSAWKAEYAALFSQHFQQTTAEALRMADLDLNPAQYLDQQALVWQEVQQLIGSVPGSPNMDLFDSWVVYWRKHMAPAYALWAAETKVPRVLSAS